MTKKTVGINPKDIMGAKKPNLALVPSSAIIGMALAFQNGAEKYGPFNWREEGKPVQYMTYLSADLRHTYEFIDGEDVARDSLMSHLAHKMAGIAVLYDAIANGNAIDDRPTKGVAADLIEEYTKKRSLKNRNMFL